MNDAIGLTVTFKKPLTEEYVGKIAEAISLFEGVAQVDIGVMHPMDYMHRVSIRRELLEKIYTLVDQAK